MSGPTKSADPDDVGSILPPGQRDPSGFWYPVGYTDPRTLVRPRVRRRRERSPARERATGTGGR